MPVLALALLRCSSMFCFKILGLADLLPIEQELTELQLLIVSSSLDLEAQ